MKEENVLGAGDRYFSAGDQAASLVLWYRRCLKAYGTFSVTAQHGESCFQTLHCHVCSLLCRGSMEIFSLLGEGSASG